MLTISKIAKKFGLSRTTLLYYEGEKLLEPTCRSESGYRYYNQDALQRLAKIVAYRECGLDISTIKLLLSSEQNVPTASLLESHFNRLGEQILILKTQQKAIAQILQKPMLMTIDKLSKERWVQIMADSGLSENDMQNWHREFERLEPEAHQTFLESLDIPEFEIAEIRQWSKNEK